MGPLSAAVPQTKSHPIATIKLRTVFLMSILHLYITEIKCLQHFKSSDILYTPHTRVWLHCREWAVHPRPGVAVRDDLHQCVLATVLLPATAGHTVQPRTDTSAEALLPRGGRVPVSVQNYPNRTTRTGPPVLQLCSTFLRSPPIRSSRRHMLIETQLQ
jgi:hypothetical protein